MVSWSLFCLVFLFNAGAAKVRHHLVLTRASDGILAPLLPPIPAVRRELQQHLSTAVTVAQSLVSHLSAAAEDFHDVGRCFTLMARYEEKIAQSVGQYTPNGSSAVQRAADLQAAGYASLRQHAVDKQVRWAAEHYSSVQPLVACLWRLCCKPAGHGDIFPACTLGTVTQAWQRLASAIEQSEFL
jgi:hypothetical protein